MLTARTHSAKRASATRDPGRTRTHLLETAFAEIYRGGFQGTGLDRILERAKVTKGALYHHFASKEELGYAIVEEVITNITVQKWLVPLARSDRPLDALIGVIQGTSLAPTDVAGGCPLNNLAQEMSPVDEGFRQRVARVFKLWLGTVTGALEEARKRGQIRADINVDETAMFVIAAYEGYMSLAKNAQDAEVLRGGIRTLTHYLESLRAG